MAVVLSPRRDAGSLPAAGADRLDLENDVEDPVAHYIRSFVVIPRYDSYRKQIGCLVVNKGTVSSVQFPLP